MSEPEDIVARDYDSELQKRRGRGKRGTFVASAGAIGGCLVGSC